MKILVTGIDGCVGTVAGPYLMGREHDVIGIDTGFYRTGWPRLARFHGVKT